MLVFVFWVFPIVIDLFYFLKKSKEEESFSYKSYEGLALFGCQLP
jgi:hypothetical protein